MKNYQGFTLIELIIVIAVLGILAAVAIPKYIDVQQQARQAALSGVIGAVEAGSAINYAARKAGNTTNTVATNGGACGTVVPALLSGGLLPTGYTVTAKTLSSTNDAMDTCTISAPGTPTLNSTANILILS